MTSPAQLSSIHNITWLRFIAWQTTETNLIPEFLQESFLGQLGCGEELCHICFTYLYLTLKSIKKKKTIYGKHKNSDKNHFPAMSGH